MNNPRLYATFLLWLLVRAVRATARGRRSATSRSSCSSSTRRTCCSTTRPQALLEKIEQVVRLIRSKGVGVYFVTQNPLDIPDTVLGQLGNRVQHALRAFTPRDQKAVKAAAETMRANPGARHRGGDHRARRRRGAGLVARREGHARRSSSARGSCRRRRRSGRSRPEERKQLIAASVGGGRIREARSIASRPTRSSRRARETARPIPTRRRSSVARPAPRRRRPRPRAAAWSVGSATSCSGRPGRAADGARA